MFKLSDTEPTALTRVRDVVVVACAVFGLSVLGEFADFHEDRIHSISLEAGVALVAALRLRLWGAIGVFVGFLMERAHCGYADMLALWEATVYAAGAYFGGSLMLRLHKLRGKTSFTFRWLCFFAGVSFFSLCNGLGVFAGLLATGETLERIISVMSLTLIIEPLGAASVGAVLSNLHELRERRCRETGRSVIGAAALTALLVLVVGVILEGFGDPEGASTIIILLALPISIWLALMPHSFAGAMISTLGFHAALWLVARHHGSPLVADYALIAAAYLAFVLAFQLVHAVNLDRLVFMKELADRRDELERRVLERTAKLQAMTERAIDADKTKSDFLAKMSHELRTPLNGVIGVSNILAAQELDAMTRHHVEVIRSSGMHLLDLIEGVLSHAKLAARDRSAPVATRFNLHKLIAQTVAEASVVASQRLKILTEIDAAAMDDMVGDAVGLRQVVTNLVGNAIKFTNEGEIVVRVSTRQGAGGKHIFRIAVADTGIGISPEDQERIFQPFEQVDGSATRAIGGAGLGLTISREIVARLGGELRVKSVVGEGTTFWFEFQPAVDAAVAA